MVGEQGLTEYDRTASSIEDTLPPLEATLGELALAETEDSIRPQRSDFHILPSEDELTPLDLDEDPDAEDAGDDDKLLDSVDEPTAEDLEDPELSALVNSALEYEEAYFVYSLDQFGYAAGKFKLLSAAQEVQLAKSIERGDMRAKEKMVNSNLRLANAVARKYSYSGVELADLVQEANICLIRAVEKFDWRKGHKFSTYAMWWVRQGCQRAVANTSRTIRAPVEVHERIVKLSNKRREFVAEHGFEPDDQELSEITGLGISDIQEARATVAIQPVSMHELMGSDKGKGDGEIGDFITDPNALTAQEELVMNEQVAEVDAALDGLTLRERRVIEMRFGMKTHASGSIGATALALGITMKEVRKIERSAHQKLQTIYGVNIVTSSASQEPLASPSLTSLRPEPEIPQQELGDDIESRRQGRIIKGVVGLMQLPRPFTPKEVRERTEKGEPTPLDLMPTSYWHNPDGSMRFDEEALGADF